MSSPDNELPIPEVPDLFIAESWFPLVELKLPKSRSEDPNYYDFYNVDSLREVEGVALRLDCFDKTNNVAYLISPDEGTPFMAKGDWVFVTKKGY